MSNSTGNQKQSSGGCGTLIFIVILVILLIRNYNKLPFFAEKEKENSVSSQMQEEADDRVETKKEEEDPLAFLDIPQREGNREDSAPYVTMTEFFEMDKPYKEFSIDWRCDQDAINTYFNVHSWYAADDAAFNGIKAGSGYAGFQNVNGGHIIIFSLWEAEGINPTVEFSKKGSRISNFDGEGSGTNIKIPYDWQTGKWYTLSVRAGSEGQKTYYDLMICPEGGKSEILATMSLPVAGMGFPYDMTFLEDYTFNGLERADSFRNITAVTGDGNTIHASQIYFSECSDKWQEVANQSLKCTYTISAEHVISLRASGTRLTEQNMFPAWEEI